MPDELEKILGRLGVHTCDNSDCVEKRPLKEAEAQLNALFLSQALDLINGAEIDKNYSGHYKNGAEVVKAELRQAFQAKYGGK